MAEAHVIYHGGCHDGFGALWAVHAAGIEFTAHPMGYNRPPPDGIPEGARVIICDFSFDRETTIALARHVGSAGSLWVFDHHATAQTELDGIEHDIGTGIPHRIVFDMDRSGAQITWDELHGGQRPELLDYVGKRDLWLMHEPNVPEMGAYIKTMPTGGTSISGDLVVWDRLMAEPIDDMLQLGKGAYAARLAMANDVALSARIVEIGGVRMPVAPCSYSIGSEAAEAMCVMYDSPIAAYYIVWPDGGYQYGFRSRGPDAPHVGEFAKQFGGGGHANASGAKSDGPLHEPLA